MRVKFFFRMFLRKVDRETGEDCWLIWAGRVSVGSSTVGWIGAGATLGVFAGFF